jgi:hypothetical protein
MMEIINAIFGPILLVLLLLVFFGMIAGVKSDRIVTTYLNLVVQVFVSIAEVLIKIAVPFLKQTGQHIVCTTNHYLAEQEKQKQQAVTTGIPAYGAGTPKTTSNASATPPAEPAPAKSANPYDQPAKPEIMH